MNTKHEHRQDLTLAQRAARGEQAAWRAIYEDSADGLFNLLHFQTGDREVACDLVQETFVTAMKSVDAFRGEGALGAWLRSIAMRKCLDWRRGMLRQARKRLLLLTEAERAPQPRLKPIRFDAEEATFRAALTKLSSKQRASLLLREVEDLPFREIAEILACNEATARVHHHRARESMRKTLGDPPTGELVDEMEGMQP